MKEIVLITGGNGYIGQYVQKLLKDEYDIRIFKGNLFETNIDEYISKIRPNYLVNLAWETQAGYLTSYNNVLFMRKGLELYEAFYKYGGKKAVFIGTEQEYKRNSIPLKEQDTIEPESLYAECKADLGKILMKYSKISGNKFVWARLFFVYGTGEKPKRLMPSIISGLLNNEEVWCSYQEYVRDYIHVEDVARAIKCCLFADYTGFVNIAGGRETKIGEIAEIIKGNIGGSGEVKFKPHSECNQPLHIQGDIAILESLGYKPYYSLEEGLKKEINDMREDLNE